MNLDPEKPSSELGLEADEPLPAEPDRPDCCNGGCAVCVLDGFDEEMDAWRQQCGAVTARNAARAAARASAGIAPDAPNAGPAS